MTDREVFVSLAAGLRTVLPALAADVIAAVGSEVAEYARPFEGRFGRNLNIGVHRALSAFIDLLEDPGRPTLPRSIYLDLGRGEAHEGRELDALLSAYRVGARVAWRTVGDRAVAAGASPQALVQLAEMLFTYIDGLSALSVRGYAQEQATRAGERDRRRVELARLLLSGVDDESLRELATLARWAIPDQVVTVLLPPGDVPSGLPANALVWPRDDDIVALVPCSAEFGVEHLRRRLRHVAAVIGLVVVPREARHSLEAAIALRQVGAGGPAVREPLLVDDHLLDLVLRADPALLERLSGQLLAPLEQAPASSRERLSATLLTWLAYAGARNAVAQALHVHPQTVRYRMAQLREIFGDALDDPERRTALQIVLRAAHGPVPDGSNSRASETALNRGGVSREGTSGSGPKTRNGR